VQVSDGNTSVKRSFLLQINPELRISRDIDLVGRDSFKLKATGGSQPYRWQLDGAKPDWMELSPDDGTIKVISRYIRGAETGQFTASVVDSAANPHADKASFSVTARPASRWRHPLNPRNRPEITQFEIEVRPKWHWPSFSGVGRLSFWLGLLAIGIPTFGAIWIFIYAFTTPGSHGTYLGVGMLTGLAAFVIGCLIGFLFGIPRVISSGQAPDLRQRLCAWG
jgi:hypothetical protein